MMAAFTLLTALVWHALPYAAAQDVDSSPPLSDQLDMTMVCATANQDLPCLAKTWIACQYGPGGSHCALIGLESSRAIRPQIADPAYSTSANDPEIQQLAEQAMRSPWQLSVDDLMRLDMGIEWMDFRVRPTPPGRVNSSHKMARRIAGSTEILITAMDPTVALDYSLFVKHASAGWRIVAWHGAQAPFGGQFGCTYDNTKWSDTCGSFDRYNCLLFAHGLTAWSLGEDNKP